jgi:hypothetical protein
MKKSWIRLTSALLVGSVCWFSSAGVWAGEGKPIPSSVVLLVGGPGAACCQSEAPSPLQAPVLTPPVSTSCSSSACACSDKGCTRRIMDWVTYHSVNHVRSCCCPCACEPRPPLFAYFLDYCHCDGSPCSGVSPALPCPTCGPACTLVSQAAPAAKIQHPATAKIMPITATITWSQYEETTPGQSVTPARPSVSLKPVTSPPAAPQFLSGWW